MVAVEPAAAFLSLVKATEKPKTSPRTSASHAVTSVPLLSFTMVNRVNRDCDLCRYLEGQDVNGQAGFRAKLDAAEKEVLSLLVRAGE